MILTSSEPAGALDSSLKKHTTLLNRLKSTILIGPADTLIKEIDGLTLTKYLEEIVGAVVEGVSKGRGDPDAAVEVGHPPISHFEEYVLSRSLTADDRS